MEQVHCGVHTVYLSNFSHCPPTPTAVDISGDWALLSSPSHDSNRGKVNVYYFTGWNWTFSSAITAPNPIAGERFGHAVSIHEETAAVGVPLYNGQGHSDSGGVFMFYRAPRGEFQLQGILVPNVTGPEWGCGQSVAVRDDYVVFGCPDEDEGGKAFLFQRVVATVDPVAAAAAGVPVDEFHHTWTQTAELHTPRVANGELFGWSVAIALSYNPSDMWGTSCASWMRRACVHTVTHEGVWFVAVCSGEI